MSDPSAANAQPLLEEAVSRDARFGKKVVPALIAFSSGLALALVLGSVPQTAQEEPGVNMAAGMAMRSAQSTASRFFMKPTIPQVRPLESLQPMTTVYNFQPASTPAQWVETVPTRSVQTKAVAQPGPAVQATGEAPEGLPWVVMKFGGTSVSTPERWNVITTEMKKVRADGKRPFVAISALGSVTNKLGRSVDEALEKDIAPNTEGSNYKWIYDAHMDLAEKLGVKDDTEGMKPLIALLEELERLLEGVRLTREVSPKLRARVSSFGELMSTQLGIMAIRKAGIPCVRLDARKLLKSTESLAQQDEDRYMQAIVNPSSNTELVATEMESMGADLSMDPNKASAVLVQGFIGSTPKGDTCLLGRGGSDTSGALFAALVKASRYEIWTDVHGLFTSDPRFVEGTRLIKSTNYRTAQELATLGAKVLHERCLVPAAWAGIPVEVHNTADPDGPSTRIEAAPEKSSTVRMLGVAVRKEQVLLVVKTSNSLWGEPTFLSSVFKPFGELGVSVDMVAMSQYTVSLALDYIPGGTKGDTFSRLYEQLSKLGTVTMKDPVAVVSIVGENLRDALPELGTALAEMRKKTVYLMSQSSEDLSMSFVVDEAEAPSVVQGLHNILLCGTAEDGSCQVDQECFGQTWDELKTEFLKVEAR